MSKAAVMESQIKALMSTLKLATMCRDEPPAGVKDYRMRRDRGRRNGMAKCRRAWQCHLLGSLRMPSSSPTRNQYSAGLFAPGGVAKTPRSKVLCCSMACASTYINRHLPKNLRQSRNVPHTFTPDDDFEGARGPRAHAVNEAYNPLESRELGYDAKGEADATSPRSTDAALLREQFQWQATTESPRTRDSRGERGRRELKRVLRSIRFRKRCCEYGNDAMLQNSLRALPAGRLRLAPSR